MVQKHVVIVGAGPGGLTAAMILARRGFKVSVFEKAATVGGRNAPIELGGFRFDTGPTFLMMEYILKEMFEEAGRRVEDYLQFTRLDVLYSLQFHDQTILSRFDRAQMKDEIRRHFPGQESGVDRFLRSESKRFAMLYPCLQKHYSAAWTMVSWPLIRALPYLGLGKSLFGLLGNYFSPERLKLSFTFQSKYLGMSPWECPALFSMIPYSEHSHGIYHVAGGLNRISETMARVAVENGAVIRTGTPVTSVVTDRGAATGVCLQGGSVHSADAVIINADFAYAMANLVPQSSLHKYRRGKLERRDFSCSTFMLYLGLDTCYDQPHHTVVFARDYTRNVDDIFKRKTISDDMSIYVQNPSVTDPSLAPPGKSAVYVLVPVPNLQGHVDWDAEKNRFRELVLSTLEQRTAMHDLRRHIETEKIITPLDWERDYNIFFGAVFNLSHKFSQLLYFRPRNRFEELRSCYLVGGGTHPGSGLPTIYESARISSNLICDRFGVPYTRPVPWPHHTLAVTNLNEEVSSHA